MNAERRLPSCLVPIDFSIVGATVEADSNDGDKPMTVLSKLTLSDKTKAAMLTSPEAEPRGKMLGAPDLQAKAMLNGET